MKNSSIQSECPSGKRGIHFVDSERIWGVISGECFESAEYPSDIVFIDNNIRAESSGILGVDALDDRPFDTVGRFIDVVVHYAGTFFVVVETAEEISRVTFFVGYDSSAADRTYLCRIGNSLECYTVGRVRYRCLPLAPPKINILSFKVKVEQWLLKKLDAPVSMV